MFLVLSIVLLMVWLATGFQLYKKLYFLRKAKYFAKKECFQVFESNCLTADMGLTKMVTYHDTNIIVDSFDNTPGKIQLECCEHVFNEWHEINNVLDVSEQARFIHDNWQGFDILFVAHDKHNFVGCIGVHRQAITHLYVVPWMRKRGYASLLLDVAESYLIENSFTEARLTCAKELVLMYQKRGYVGKSTWDTSISDDFLACESGLELMVKSLSPQSRVVPW